MKVIRHGWNATAGLALALMLAACGSPTGPPEVLPSPAPPVPTPRPAFTLDRGEGSLPNLVALFRPLATSETGAFDLTTDWTFAANNIDVYLFRGACSLAQFNGRQCTLAASSTTSSKPERFRLANQAAGAYTLVVANFGPGDESIAYQVVFTPGASAASHGTAPGTFQPTRQLRGGVVTID